MQDNITEITHQERQNPRTIDAYHFETQSIPSCFEQQVAEYPDRIAVRTRSHTITYDTLNQAANRLARYLLSYRGDGGEPVLLLLSEDIPMITGILGVLKAGKIFVPLNLSYPHARIVSILETMPTCTILTDRTHLRSAREYARNGVEVIDIGDIGATLSPENLHLPLTPETFAGIFYTSGSTGQPKGVIQNHGNIMHKIHHYAQEVHICPDDRLLLLASYSVGVSLWNLYGALLNGATLFPFDLKQEGLTALVEWLIHENITMYHSTPTVFRHLIQALDEESILPDIRLIRLAGEPVYRRDIEQFRRHFTPECLLYIALSATESGGICQHAIDHKTPITDERIAAGYPAPDKEIRIVDESGREVDDGQPGEIIVKSRYLSPGYWQRPDLTSAVFSPVPENSDERIYKTGDIGVIQPNGCLVHLRRKDNQVKVGGHRIETSEIELALQQYDTVEETAVVAVTDAPDNQYMVAYIVMKADSVFSERDLRRHLAEYLPGFMIPSLFIQLDTFPLNVNGKIDRKALPKPGPRRTDRHKASGAPGSSLEHKLTDIWGRILDIESVGMDDNFFDSGGNSLRAIRLLHEIELIVGRQLPLTILWQAPTIRQLAQILQQGEWATPDSTLVPLQPNGSRRPFFCVPASTRTAYEYTHLARRLGDDQPVYGLQPRELDGESTPHTRIEEMAARYVADIRTLQPEGPYALGGRCFGAIVAFEMAQQLQAAGQDVALLAVLGMVLPPSELPGIRHYGNRLIQMWQQGELKGFLLRKINMNAHGLVDEHTRRIRSLQQAYRVARRSYRGRKYPGRITLFWDCERSAIPDYRAGWEQLAEGGFVCRRIKSTHITILEEPTVGDLAGQLRDCLDGVNT